MRTSKKQTQTENRSNRKRITSPKIIGRKIKRKTVAGRGRGLRVKIARNLEGTKVEIWSS